MPCYHPLPGYLSKVRNVSGKRSIVFNINDGFKDKALQVPCGKCVGCRLERSRQWAVRCMHEASLYERNCFVTLTYADAPESLEPRHFVLFMKRLRKRFGDGIRFFQCGEYGERTFRPHHHALLFNLDFPDKRVCNSSGTYPLYSSGILEGLWSHGLCFIGEVSFKSAGYVARYAMKKVYGPAAVDWYMGRVPEYLTMSRRPGIGSEWIRKFRRDVYPSDELVVNGVPSKPPRFYDDVVDRDFPRVMQRVRRRRMKRLLEDPNSTGSRLLVREAVKESAVSLVPRVEV